MWDPPAAAAGVSGRNSRASQQRFKRRHARHRSSSTPRCADASDLHCQMSSVTFRTLRVMRTAGRKKKKKRSAEPPAHSARHRRPARAAAGESRRGRYTSTPGQQTERSVPWRAGDRAIGRADGGQQVRRPSIVLRSIIGSSRRGSPVWARPDWRMLPLQRFSRLAAWPGDLFSRLWLRRRRQQADTKWWRRGFPRPGCG